MANVKLIFYGSEKSDTEKHELECFWNNHNEITISIINENEQFPSLVSLDISTAIKFSKTLRTAINEAKEGSDD